MSLSFNQQKRLHKTKAARQKLLKNNLNTIKALSKGVKNETPKMKTGRIKLRQRLRDESHVTRKLLFREAKKQVFAKKK